MITIFINILFDSITSPAFGGKSFSEYYRYDDFDDDDDYDAVIHEYREDVEDLIYKHFRENYSYKMGYDVEVELS